MNTTDKSAKPLTPMQGGNTVMITPLGNDKDCKRGTVAKQSQVRRHLWKVKEPVQTHQGRANRTHQDEDKVVEPPRICQ